MKKNANTWVVYVIQSQQPRRTASGKRAEGFFYVGCTTDVERRLRQHNGEIKGGAKYTSKHRPWKLMCTYGTYADRSEAMKAERALKRKRGRKRLCWTTEDSQWCRGREPKDRCE